MMLSKCFSIVACATTLGLMIHTAAAAPDNGSNIVRALLANGLKDPVNNCTNPYYGSGNTLTCNFHITNMINSKSTTLAGQSIPITVDYYTSGSPSTACEEEVYGYDTDGTSGYGFDSPNTKACTGANTSILITTPHDPCGIAYYAPLTLVNSTYAWGYTAEVIEATVPQFNGSCVKTQGTLTFVGGGG